MDDDDDGLKLQKFRGFVEGPKHGYVHKVNFLQRSLSLNTIPFLMGNGTGIWPLNKCSSTMVLEGSGLVELWVTGHIPWLLLKNV